MKWRDDLERWADHNDGLIGVVLFVPMVLAVLVMVIITLL